VEEHAAQRVLQVRGAQAREGVVGRAHAGHHSDAPRRDKPSRRPGPTATFAGVGPAAAATPKPVNALPAWPYTGVRRAGFAEAGVMHIPLGSAQARAIHERIRDAANRGAALPEVGR